MVGSQSIGLLEKPLPVFSELVVGRLDNYSEIFTHSPTPLLVNWTSLCLVPRFGWPRDFLWPTE